MIEHIDKMLSHTWIEKATIPGIDPVAIDLVTKRGTIFRIQPAYRSGKFHHLEVMAQPHKYEFQEEAITPNPQS